MFLSLISWKKKILKVLSVILFHCAIVVMVVDGVFIITVIDLGMNRPLGLSRGLVIIIKVILQIRHQLHNILTVFITTISRTRITKVMQNVSSTAAVISPQKSILCQEHKCQQGNFLDWSLTQKSIPWGLLADKRVLAMHDFLCREKCMDYAENSAACSSDSGEQPGRGLGFSSTVWEPEEHTLFSKQTLPTQKQTFLPFTKVKAQIVILDGDLKCTKVHRFNVDQYTTMHNSYIDM